MSQKGFGVSIMFRLDLRLRLTMCCWCWRLIITDRHIPWTLPWLCSVEHTPMCLFGHVPMIFFYMKYMPGRRTVQMHDRKKTEVQTAQSSTENRENGSGGAFPVCWVVIVPSVRGPRLSPAPRPCFSHSVILSVCLDCSASVCLIALQQRRKECVAKSFPSGHHNNIKSLVLQPAICFFRDQVQQSSLIIIHTFVY